MASLFRFRSSTRDAATDRSRIDSVRKAIVAARQSAAGELQGLKRRVAEAQTNAALQWGNELAPQGRAEPGRDAELARNESTLTRGLLRIQELQAHIQKLDLLEQTPGEP